MARRKTQTNGSCLLAEERHTYLHRVPSRSRSGSNPCQLWILKCAARHTRAPIEEGEEERREMREEKTEEANERKNTKGIKRKQKERGRAGSR